MADITDDIDSLFAEADRLIDAGNPEGYGLLGEAHYIQGDYENASVAFEKGIEMKVVAFRPKGFRCACVKEYGLTYSYHSGRHSFASLITLEAGVPM